MNAPVRTSARVTPGERRAFCAAAAAVVLHALVDALVFVEPGVTRADRLVPGLVPAALVGLAAWLLPRVPAGLAAASALLLGALASVGFLVVVAGVRADGLGGGDLTGLLLAPAGVAFIVLGVRILWRARRRERWSARRVLRLGLLAVAALLVLYWILLPAGFALVATHRPRDVEPVADLGRAHEEVTIRTDDGLDLWAQYVPSRNGAAIVLYPGEWADDHARMLLRHGYGVLLLDPRGYGRSDGDPNAYGWGAARDIEAAARWLGARREIDDGRVGGLGLSVGGELMIEAAAGGDALRGVVSEGAGIRSVREAFVREGPDVVELALQYPMDLVQTVATAVFSGDAPPPSLEELVARVSPGAVFLVYGERGQPIEATVNPPYYRAAGEPKAMWEVPGAEHTGGLRAQPEEYERRVVAFFDRELRGD